MNLETKPALLTAGFRNESTTDVTKLKTRTERPAPAPTSSPATGVQTVAVTPDEAGMRVDRFLEAKFPGLSFSHIQRVIRKGELRVNGKRAQPKDRLAAGQGVRIPPLRPRSPRPPLPGPGRRGRARRIR